MGLTDEHLVAVPGLASRWVRLANGAKAHYMTAGDEGPAVVLLHGGLPGSSGTAGWRFTAPFLGANGFRVYAPDQPAFGLSDTREEHWPRDISSFVDFVHDFTTALAIDEFHLAGNSMGCMNTVNYLLAHPERVKSFVLIAGAVGDIVPAAARVESNVKIPTYDGSREGMRAMMEAIIYRGEAISDDLVEMRYLQAKAHAAAHQRFFPSLLQWSQIVPWTNENLAARLSTKGRLDRITIPGLYLYGRDDVIAPVENGYAQEDVLPGIQFFYPSECGHQGQTDQPDVFNQVFLEFFRDGVVTRTTAEAAGVSDRRPPIPALVATTGFTNRPTRDHASR